MAGAAIKRRSQIERRAESERRLMEATLDVIATDGVTAATFETIGERAGYSRGLATRHFGSKQGLIDAVVDYLHEHQDAAMAAAHLEEANGLAAVLTYVSRYCKALKKSSEPQAYFMLLSDAVANAHDTRSVFRQSHARVKTRLAKLIRRGQAEGVIRRDVTPDDAALMVGSLLLGISMQCLIDPHMRVDAVARTVAAMLTRGFAPSARKVAND
ncbi:MAG: TetR/AcrR family transcriptional regulator [Terricaulis sp.]